MLKKQLLNIVSILLLLIIMIILIIILCNFRPTNTINNINSNTTQTTNSFTYKQASKSTLNNINFENNFGGSNSDTICDVITVNNHIIIGKTKSNDCYFYNNNNCLFVAVVDFLGNLKHITTSYKNYDFKYINSVVFNNKIYILVNHNGYIIFEYNLSNNTLNQAFSGKENGLKIVCSSTIAIFNEYENKSYVFYPLLNKKILLNNKIENLVFTQINNLQILFAYNTNNSLDICSVSPTAINDLKKFINCTAINYCYNLNNYIFLIEHNNKQEYLILDSAFNTLFNTSIPQTNKSNIFNFDSYNTMIYLTNAQLKYYNFCSHGDKLKDDTILNNVNSYFCIQLNDSIIIVASQTNQLSIYKLQNNQLTFLNIYTGIYNIEINNIKTINSNLTFFVNYNLINPIITNSYGNTDFAMFEYLL